MIIRPDTIMYFKLNKQRRGGKERIFKPSTGFYPEIIYLFKTSMRNPYFIKYFASSYDDCG